MRKFATLDAVAEALWPRLAGSTLSWYFFRPGKSGYRAGDYHNYRKERVPWKSNPGLKPD